MNACHNTNSCSFQHSEAFFTVSHWQEVPRHIVDKSGSSFPILSRLLNEDVFGLNRPEHELLEPSDMARLCQPTAAKCGSIPLLSLSSKGPSSVEAQKLMS